MESMDAYELLGAMVAGEMTGDEAVVELAGWPDGGPAESDALNPLADPLFWPDRDA